VLAKLGTVEMVGQLAFALAVTAPLILFANLQLRALLASDGGSGGRFSPYFTLRLLSTVLALVVIAGIACLANYPSEMKAIIVLVGLFKAVEAMSDIFHGELQRRAHMKWICFSLVLRGLLGLAALALGVYLTHRLEPACLGITLAWLLVLLAVDVPCVAPKKVSGTLKPKVPDTFFGRWQTAFFLCWDPQPLKRLLLIACPLGLVAMLISLNVCIPRYFLAWYGGERALGVYSALAYLVQASTLLAAALGASASGRLGYCYAVRDRMAWGRTLHQLLGLSLLFGVVGLAVAWFGGSILLTFFYAREYAQHQEVFCWLMLAAVGANLCFILNWAVVAARYITIQLPFHLLLLLVTAAACYLLIPPFGLRGAAFSAGITNGCQVLGNILILRHAARSLSMP
jgi:O-antigen/teichoic acid export membrane protein